MEKSEITQRAGVAPCQSQLLAEKNMDPFKKSVLLVVCVVSLFIFSLAIELCVEFGVF